MLCGQAYRKLSVSTPPSAAASFLSSASVFALISATSRWLNFGSSVSCKCRLGKADHQPCLAPSKRIFHCLLLGFENDRHLSRCLGATPKRNGQVSLASMRTFAMPAIVVRRLHARGRAYREFSAYRAGDSVFATASRSERRAG